MTRTEVAQTLAYLVSAWPKVEIGDETAEVWVDQLAHIPAVDAEAAARRAVATCKWFPSPAEFLEICHAEARSRDDGRRGLPAPPADVDPASAPSCPCCEHRDRIERLSRAVMGHTWLCGTCWTTFAGTTGEWDRMHKRRVEWREQHQPKDAA